MFRNGTSDAKPVKIPRTIKPLLKAMNDIEVDEQTYSYAVNKFRKFMKRFEAADKKKEQMDEISEYLRSEA